MLWHDPHLTPSFFISLFTLFFYICSSSSFLSPSPSLQLQCFFLLLFFLSSHLLLILSFSSFFISSHRCFCGFCCTFLWVYLFLYQWVLFGLMQRRERERERETAAGFLFMGCVFVRWLGCVSWVFKGWDRWVWVAVVVGGGVALLACRAEQSRCSCYVHWWRVQPDATVSFWV